MEPQLGRRLGARSPASFRVSRLESKVITARQISTPPNPSPRTLRPFWLESGVNHLILFVIMIVTLSWDDSAFDRGKGTE